MIAPAKFLGWQDGCVAVPGFPLFNLSEAIEGHPAGSTVSAQTLEAAGFDLPPFGEIRQHPRGGYTRAVPAGGTTRIYCGWWPTRGAALADFFCPGVSGKPEAQSSGIR